MSRRAFLPLMVVLATLAGCETLAEKDERYRSGAQQIFQATRGSSRHLDDRHEALQQLHHAIYD